MNTPYSTDDSRWAAVTTRDAHADGTFFYAVRTTGVFCRPSCASRLPRREHVSFFADPAAARAAGFRPCKRCRPEGLPRELGMAPSAFRRQGAGLRIDYASAATPLGMVLVAATAQGICRIAFGDEAAPLVAELKLAFARAELVEAPSRVAPFVAQIRAYLDGTRHTFDLPLDIAPTAFQQRVWEALTHIPYGETRSYSDIAEALGAPRAVRAVAAACASNPVALAIPCHRVVQKGGALAGYRWGVRRKATLLAAEARHAGADETEVIEEGNAV